MHRQLSAQLTAVSVSITLCVAAALLVSPWWALALAITSALAVTASWLTFRASAVDASDHDRSVSPLLLAIVLDVVLATCRYVGHLSAQLPDVFVPTFPVTPTSCFVTFTVAPISLMLLCASFLTRRAPLGVFGAYWSALYIIGDAALQLRLLPLVDAEQRTAHGVGAGVALAQALLAMKACQRLLAPAVVRKTAFVGLTKKQRNLWTVLFVCAVVVYAATLFRQAGALPVGVIAGSMMGGLAGWRKTTSRQPADPTTMVPLFLLLLALFYGHIGEEALTSFNRAIAELSGTPWDEREFTLLIGLIGPIVWFSAAWSLWQGQPFGNFVLWFLIVGMILGEPTHLLVFPVLAMEKSGGRYAYFSGMYTALFPMVPAVLALVGIVQDHRRRQL